MTKAEIEAAITELEFLDNLIGFLESLSGDDGKPDEHRHHCPNKDCGTVWHHDRNKLLDEEGQYQKAHTCPKCGTEQRMKYRGSKAASCFYDGKELREEIAA